MSCPTLRSTSAALLLFAAGLSGACSSSEGGTATATPDAGATPDAAVAEPEEGICTVTDESSTPDSLREIPCKKDFLALSSAPIDATLPGSRS
ncbi:MAG: hypothetical protein RL385_4726, partial [Pseudomonadota bacterium]